MRGLLAIAVVTVGFVATSCGSDTSSAPPATVDSSSAAESAATESEIEPVVRESDASPATEPVATAETDTDASPDTEPDAAVEELFPDILEAVATETNGSWQFDVTVSSPYDSPARYADGFRVLGPDGSELGFRLLTHDHASEQPFTRSLQNVVIADDITSVTIEGRDQLSGFGGDTIEVVLPGR